MSAVIGPSCTQLLMFPPPALQALEVDAYASVQDMIHAAIVQHGSQATLRQVGSCAVALALCWLSQTLALVPTYFDGCHCTYSCRPCA
jgi:hypothetical protein